MRTWTAYVSGVAVVVFSVESMCSQYDSVAVQPDGIDTVCARVSVSFVPLPLNHAIHDPEWAGSAEVAWVIGLNPSVEDCVHGAVLVPFSKPGFPISCCAAAELMVSEMIVV